MSSIARAVRFLSLCASISIALLISTASAGPAGDVAPRGNVDDELNVADLVLIEKFLYGLITPNSTEIEHTDVAPLGAPDGIITIADLLLLEQVVYGLRPALPPINVGPIPLSGNITSGTVILDEGATYEVTGNVTVSSNAVLIIRPGATLLFDGSADGLTINGSLLVQGSENNKVTFTSSKENPGFFDWAGIKITAGDGSEVDIDHVVIRHAIKGVWVDNAGAGRTVIIRNSLIENNNYGIEFHRDSHGNVFGNRIVDNKQGLFLWGGISDDGNPLPSITQNEIHSNVTRNIYAARFQTPGLLVDATNNWWGVTDIEGIGANITDESDGQLCAGNCPYINFGQYLDSPMGQPANSFPTLIGSVTGELVANETYEVLSDLTIPDLSSLIIREGATLLFGERYHGLNVNGALFVDGKESAKVTFISGKVTKSVYDWKGIRITQGDGSDVNIQHARIEYGEVGIYLDDVGNERVVNINNSLIQNNVDGISFYRNSQASVTANQFANSIYGIRIHGNGDSTPRPTITANDIAVDVNAYGYSSIVNVNMTNNWWGVSDASAISQIIHDRHDNEDGAYVDFGQYLDGPGGTPAGPSLVGVISGLLDAAQTSEILGDLVIVDNTTLTIPADTTLSFENPSHGMHVFGSLISQGTENSKVTFTSASAAKMAGDWEGLRIYEGDSSTLDIHHIEVDYAATGIFFEDVGNVRDVTVRDSSIHNNVDGITFSGNSSAVVIQDSNVTDNERGFILDGHGTTAPQPRITNNNMDNNSLWNVDSTSYSPEGVNVDAKQNWWGVDQAVDIAETINDQQDASGRPYVDFGEFLDGPNGTTTGPALSGVIVGQLSANTSYQVLSDLIVEDGTTLTIPQGVTLVFENPEHGLIVSGSLIVAGEENNKVVFTSAQTTPSAGNWEGIRVTATGEDDVTIAHAVIEYAIDGISLDHVDSLRTVTIRDSLIQLNTNGIEIIGDSTASVIDNKIIANDTGIYLDGDQVGSPQPIVTHNGIFDNYDENLYTTRYQSPDTIVDAKENWWGSSNAAEIETTIYDRQESSSRPIVNYSHYLDGPGGSPVWSGLTLFGDVSGTLESGKTYEVLSDLRIDENDVLTIPQGVTLLFHDPSHGLEVYGGLQVDGLPGDEVVFTTSDGVPAVGAWQGIFIRAFSPSPQVVSISHAVIEYAVYGIQLQSGVVSSSVAVADSLIQYSQDGIHNGASDTSLSVTDSRIVNNDVGVRLDGGFNIDPQLEISTSDLYGNSSFNILTERFELPDSSSIEISASGNYWGVATLAEVSATIRDFSDYPEHTPIVDMVGFSSTALQAPTVIASTTYAFISPGNVDGIQDSVIFSATLSESADWSAEIVDSSGNVLHSASDFANPQISITWDGKDTVGTPQPEGLYAVRFTSTSADATRSGLAGLGRMIIDNTAPTAVVSLDSLIQNGIETDIYGTADDVNFESYDLEYSSDLTPAVHEPIVLGDTEHIFDSDLASWVTGTDQGDAAKVIPNGDYTVRLSVVDRAGNISEAFQGVTIDQVSLTQVSQNVDSIDLSQSETFEVLFDVSAPGDVTLTIYDEQSGLPIRTDVLNIPDSGSYPITWDGLDDFGNPVPNEAYRFSLRAQSGDRVGDFSPATPPASSQGLVSSAHNGGVFNPFENESWKISFTLPVPARVQVRMDYDPGGPAAGFPYGEGVAFSAGGHSLTWNGVWPTTGEIFPGSFFGSSTYTPFPPNTVVVAGSYGSQMISGQSPNLEVKADPYWISLSYGQLTRIRYQLQTPGGQMANIVIKILPSGISDFNHALAIEIFSGQLPPGPHNLLWTGIDPDDTEHELDRIISQDGAKHFAIQASVGGVSTLYRGVMNVDR